MDDSRHAARDVGERAAHGNFVPRLAREVPTLANGGISADGLTITYRAIMNPNNDVISRHGYDVVRRVETPDPLTVVFRLRERFAPFVAVVFGESDSPYAVLPEHLLARYASLNNVSYNSAPVGTGPFKFVRWQRGDRIEYVRNDAYYLGPPKIRRIVWRLVPDENTELEQMRTHEADWMYEATVGTYKAIKTMPGVAVVLPNVNGYQGLMLNSGRGPTADVRVRRAIAAAIDKNRLTSELTDGAAAVATGDLPGFLWAADPGLRSLPYEPGDARKQLAALGYSRARPLALDLVYEQSSAVNHALVVQLQAQLHAVGIEVHPRSQLSSVIYGGYAAGGTLARGNYAPAVRKPAYAAIEGILVRDAPIVFLWWPRNIQVLNPDLHGFDPNPVVETWDIASWSI